MAAPQSSSTVKRRTAGSGRTGNGHRRRLRSRDPLRQSRYELATAVMYGAGILEHLPQLLAEAGVANPLVVTDKGLSATPIPGRVTSVLERAGIRHAVFADVEPDPSTEVVERIADTARRGRHDGVIGLGGGSPMDAAKAAAAVVTSGQQVTELVGVENVSCDPLPIIAIPTTAGTGSEVTRYAVLSDHHAGTKASISSMRIMPRFAVLEPELTVGLPPALTASTGLDALGHAIESYGSVWNNPVSEGMALNAITLVGRHLRTAVNHPDDLVARAGMLAASAIAELAANTTRLGLAHALAVPLGATHHIPHGVGVAMLLLPMSAYNEEAEPDRYRSVAAALDPGSSSLTDALKSMYEDVGLTARLRDFGVSADDYDRVTALAMRSDNVLANPREVDASDLRALLEQAQ